MLNCYDKARENTKQSLAAAAALDAEIAKIVDGAANGRDVEALHELARRRLTAHTKLAADLRYFRQSFCRPIQDPARAALLRRDRQTATACFLQEFYQKGADEDEPGLLLLTLWPVFCRRHGVDEYRTIIAHNVDRELLRGHRVSPRAAAYAWRLLDDVAEGLKRDCAAVRCSPSNPGVALTWEQRQERAATARRRADEAISAALEIFAARVLCDDRAAEFLGRPVKADVDTLRALCKKAEAESSNTVTDYELGRTKKLSPREVLTKALGDDDIADIVFGSYA